LILIIINIARTVAAGGKRIEGIWCKPLNTEPDGRHFRR
jgi:hypothetical protein